MSELKPHTSIGTMYGSTVTVIRRIGGGGQGDVYEVLYGGEHKALKWYRIDRIKDVPRFVRNLKNNIMDGSPTPEFLWPLDMTEYYDHTFGYIMDLCPPNYIEAKEFLLRRAEFASYRRRIDACLHIVSAFRVLHGKGYSYQDINAGNFFIEPSTGKVLICDNDNVVTNGMENGVLGTLSYMAPEIIMRKSFPNKYSDRHSLAVLLYRLLLGPHPLEGGRSARVVLDNETRSTLFGSEALFAMDPYDPSNAPDPNIQGGLIKLWAQLPEHLRSLFVRAFSQDALHHPEKRPMEVDWLKALTRFRSEVVSCSCGNEVCCEHGRPVMCDECGSLVRVPYVAQVRDVVLPVTRDMRVYRCQLGAARQSEALDLVAYVVGSVDNPAVLGLRNMTKIPWKASAPGRGFFELRRDGVQQIRPGLVVFSSRSSREVAIRIGRNPY